MSAASASKIHTGRPRGRCNLHPQSEIGNGAKECATGGGCPKKGAFMTSANWDDMSGQNLFAQDGLDFVFILCSPST